MNAPPSHLSTKLRSTCCSLDEREAKNVWVAALAAEMRAVAAWQAAPTPAGRETARKRMGEARVLAQRAETNHRAIITAAARERT